MYIDVTLNTKDYVISGKKWIDGLFSLEKYGFKVEYNLTPIKPKWYEDEANFPEFVINWGYSKGKVILSKKQASNMLMDRWRLATQAEKDSLYCEKDNG